MTTDPKAPLPDTLDLLGKLVIEARDLDALHKLAEEGGNGFKALNTGCHAYNAFEALGRAYAEQHETLRSHISAQAEKIAVLTKCLQQAQNAAIELAAKNVKLEAENKRLAGLYELALNDQATIGAGFEAAEAENKRLREALEKIANNKFLSYENTEASMYGTGVTDGHRLAAQWARDALAQTAEPAKVCGTCGGDGWTKLNGERFNDCPACNGTVREVK